MNWKTDAAVCVVLASGGYPGRFETGKPIDGLKVAAALDNVAVFHAGTKRDPAGRVVTDGGRVLGVTALGRDIAAAVDRVYDAAARIRFDGVHYRRDIAARALARRG
jgi:phosphoribosylamine--glycine ligase